MAFGRLSRKGAGGTTVTTTTTTVHHPPGHDPTKKQGGLSRFGRKNKTARAAPATRAPATHQRRKPGIGDKISGGMMKLKGSMTRRPGEKAAGTRRMHGTDGRGSRRVY